MSKRKPHSTLYDFSDKMNFATYQGSKVEKVLEADPQYLRWAYLTIDWFDLTDELQEELVRKINEVDERQIGIF